jgi:DNA-binding transcriptional MerR regulator
LNVPDEFSHDELRELQTKFKDGITSVELIALVNDRGFRFSESTLRKYVQLGLLPRSKRVGRKGQRRGSIGLYPPQIISHIMAIKRGLKADRTLDDIRYRATVLSELEALSGAFAGIADGMKALLAYETDTKVKEHLERELNAAEIDFEKLLKRLQGAMQTSP